MTASLGEEAHLFLRARYRRLHYSGQVVLFIFGGNKRDCAWNKDWLNVNSDQCCAVDSVHGEKRRPFSRLWWRRGFENFLSCASVMWKLWANLFHLHSPWHMITSNLEPLCCAYGCICSYHHSSCKVLYLSLLSKRWWTQRWIFLVIQEPGFLDYFFILVQLYSNQGVSCRNIGQEQLRIKQSFSARMTIKN